jgi:hypothetical protein
MNPGTGAAMPNPKSKIENPKLLRPPQFRLRTLLLIIAACGVFFAIVRAEVLSPPALIGLVLLALSIFCHVAGNAIGTHLRDLSPRRHLVDMPPQPYPRPLPDLNQFAPSLGQRSNLGWVIVIATFLGIIVGGIGGGLWTIFSARDVIFPVNVGIGVIAFATLGGIAAFALVGFAQVLFSALRQAMNSPTSRQLTPDP